MQNANLAFLKYDLKIGRFPIYGGELTGMRLNFVKVTTDLSPKKVPLIDFLYFQHYGFGYINIDKNKEIIFQCYL